ANDDFHRHELAKILLQPGVVFDDLRLAVEQLQQVHARPHIDDAVAKNRDNQRAADGDQRVMVDDPTADSLPEAAEEMIEPGGVIATDWLLASPLRPDLQRGRKIR